MESAYNLQNTSFQNASFDIHNIIFNDVPFLTCEITFPKVCQSWKAFAEKKYGNFKQPVIGLFNITDFAKVILDQTHCPLPLDKFMAQHKKSTLYKILENEGVFNRSNYNFRLNSLEGSQDISLTHCECEAQENIQFFVRRDPKGCLHYDDKRERSDLRATLLLSYKEISKVIETCLNQDLIDEDDDLSWYSNFQQPISLFRDVTFKAAIHQLERSAWNGWKKVDVSKKKYQIIFNEMLSHIKFFIESYIETRVQRNFALLSNVKLEDFEPQTSLFCDTSGFIGRANDYTFTVAVTSINGSKALSWQPGKGDEFNFGIGSALRHAVIGKTMHGLSDKFGLKLSSKLSKT